MPAAINLELQIKLLGKIGSVHGRGAPVTLRRAKYSEPRDGRGLSRRSIAGFVIRSKRDQEEPIKRIQTALDAARTRVKISPAITPYCGAGF